MYVPSQTARERGLKPATTYLTGRESPNQTNTEVLTGFRTFRLNSLSMKKWLLLLTPALLLPLLAKPAPPAVVDVKSPAGSGSAEPNLSAAPDGRVFMTWIEPAQGKGNVLYFSVLQADTWSTPKVIARGTNWFVNPADFPSIAVMPNGTLAVQWLVTSGDPGSEAYDINLAFSTDGGSTWTKPVVPHRDHKKRQHGFASLTPTSDGKLAIIWLDGRNMANEDEGDMALMYTTVTPPGTLGPEAQIDNRVCECCKTAMAATTDGLIAVYRDRSDKEIRDISVARFAGGRWSAPAGCSCAAGPARPTTSREAASPAAMTMSLIRISCFTSCRSLSATTAPRQPAVTATRCTSAL